MSGKNPTCSLPLDHSVLSEVASRTITAANGLGGKQIGRTDLYSGKRWKKHGMCIEHLNNVNVPSYLLIKHTFLHVCAQTCCLQIITYAPWYGGARLACRENAAPLSWILIMRKLLVQLALHRAKGQTFVVGVAKPTPWRCSYPC